MSGGIGTLSGGAAFGSGKSGSGLVLTGGTATGSLTADTDRAPVTVAAISGEVDEAGLWTHLVGVYDAGSRQVLLYVNGSLAGEGTALNQWSGTGGFTVGAARKAGAATGFFPGSVDEVRFRRDVLTNDEVFALYLSQA